MATELNSCADLVSRLADQFLTFDYLRRRSLLMEYIDTVRVGHMGKLCLPSLVDQGEMRDMCAPLNYPSPDPLNINSRDLAMCSFGGEIKVPDCVFTSSSFDYGTWIARLMQSIFYQANRTLEKIIYNALIGSVTVNYVNSSGRAETKVLTMAEDIGASHIIDASAGFTFDKIVEAYTAVADFNTDAPAIFFVPFAAYYELQKEAYGKGSAFCCLLEQGIRYTARGPFGSSLFIKPLSNDVFQEVGGKIRGFMFFPGTIEFAYTTKSTLTDKCCPGDMVINANADSGYLVGIIKKNPGIQQGGVLAQYLLQAGAIRTDPRGIVAIDFAKSIIV